MRDRWKRFWTSVPGMGLRGAFIWIGLLLYTGAPFSQLTVQATGVMLVGGLVWIERRNPLPDSRAARVFSVLYALAATIGRVLDESNTLASLGSFASLARLGMTFAGLCELVYLLTRRAFRIISRSAEMREGLCPPRESGSKGRLLRDWGLIFACWLPCFLSYYPGIFSYDLPAQTQQMMGLRTFTADNPPLHTLVWGLCLRLQEATGLESLAVYGIGPKSGKPRMITNYIK